MAIGPMAALPIAIGDAMEGFLAARTLSKLIQALNLIIKANTAVEQMTAK